MHAIIRTLRSRRPIRPFGGSLTVLLVAGALFPTPAAAQAAPDGRIAFVRPSTEPSDHCFGQPCTDIWVMEADGSNQVNLTSTRDVNENDPAWSSDGTRIAYTSDAEEVGGFFDIWVMNADGSNQVNLTRTPPEGDNVHEFQPAWAPSGTQIVFVREIPGDVISEQWDLFVMDADPATSDATNLTGSDANELEPTWSPDGTKIAFAGVRNSGWEIATIDPNGQNELVLTGDGFDAEDRHPDWSPDSTKVTFMKQSQVGGCCEPWEIWAVNANGAGDTNLTNHPSNDTGPSWSPDGTEITFTSDRDATVEEPFRTDIYAIPAPTTLPPPATVSAAAETAPRRLTTDGGSSSPDWADPPVDTRAPRVIGTGPSAGATGVSPTVNVTATFSEGMSAASINGQTFKLFRQGSTTKVAATVTYTTDTRKATLDPTNPLRRGATYRAVVTTGARDVAGNRLDQNRTASGLQQKAWTFTVRS